MGATITQQAPVIALCANILRDVKAVADIKAETQEKIEEALKGTLHAFRPDSRVPAKTQLEVLDALAPLGASVKEHLIEATKSGHFPVRSEALNMLVPHLPDDDLFDMEHVLGDRSQEPIVVYLLALFERDTRRAIRFLKGTVFSNLKVMKGILFALLKYQEELERDDIIELGRKLKALSYSDLFWMIWTWNDTYGKHSEFARCLNLWATTPDDHELRSLAFNCLVRQSLSGQSFRTERLIVSRNLNGFHPWLDPLEPITSEWVNECAGRLNRDEARIWEYFESLTTILPLTLRR
jgi:hypothetical protein